MSCASCGSQNKLEFSVCANPWHREGVRIVAIDRTVKRFIEIEIPMLPPSVNHYVEHKAKGVHVKSAQAKAWERDWPIFARGQYITGDRFSVSLLYVFGPGDRYDIDNLNKCVLDCIARSGMLRHASGKWLTDSKFKRMLVDIDDEHRDQGPKTIITIEEM